MSGYTGGGWDDTTNLWAGGDAWGGDALPNSNWNSTDPPSSSWWSDPKTRTELAGLAKGLGGVKPLADPNAASARPLFPQAGIHQGQAIDALGQYLQMLQARQQQMRAQFLPKTAGLLGG